MVGRRPARRARRADAAMPRNRSPSSCAAAATRPRSSAVPRPVRCVDLVGRSRRPSRGSPFAPTRASWTTTGCWRSPGRPQWRTVTGGSRRYVDALVAPFADRIRRRQPVHKIVARRGRRPHPVEILTERGPESSTGSSSRRTAIRRCAMLGDATPAERSILGAIGYQRNIATLHTDARMLPRNPRARASWNYAVDRGSRRRPSPTG